MRIVAALALLLAVAGQARADALDDDVTCLVAVMMLPQINQQTHQMDENLAQTTTIMGAMYFLGKVKARDPQFDLEAAIITKVQQADSAALRSAMIRCGGELQAEGARWQAIGRDLIKKGGGAPAAPD